MLLQPTESMRFFLINAHFISLGISYIKGIGYIPDANLFRFINTVASGIIAIRDCGNRGIWNIFNNRSYLSINRPANLIYVLSFIFYQVANLVIQIIIINLVI